MSRMSLSMYAANLSTAAAAAAAAAADDDDDDDDDDGVVLPLLLLLLLLLLLALATRLVLHCTTTLWPLHAAATIALASALAHTALVRRYVMTSRGMWRHSSAEVGGV